MRGMVVRQPWAALIASGVVVSVGSGDISARMGIENRVVRALRQQPRTRPTPLGGIDMQDDTCSVPGCPSVAAKRGWCSKHYQRWWKHGDPNAVRKTAPGEQYETLVRWVAERDRSECWIWPYSLWSGYGILRRPGSTSTEKAHRLAFELAYGYPLEHLGCHGCDTPACCNPDHIFDGTQADNMADAKAKGRLSPPPLRRSRKAAS